MQNSLIRTVLPRELNRANALAYKFPHHGVFEAGPLQNWETRKLGDKEEKESLNPPRGGIRGLKS